MHFRLPIQAKILLGFVCVLVFFGAIFIVSFQSISTSKTISQKTFLYSNQIKLLNVLLRSLDSLEKQVDVFFVSPYAQYLSEAENKLSIIQDSLDNIKKISTKEDLSELDSINRAVQSLREEIPRIFSTYIAEANTQAKTSSIKNTDKRSIYSHITEVREKSDALLIHDSEEMSLGSSKQIAMLSNLIIQISTLWILSLVIGVVVAFFISRSISKPIIKLKYFSQDVAKGNFNITTNIDTNDEIEELAISFTQMTDALRIQRDQLKESNVILEKKVEERTKELGSNNEELKRMNKLMVNREIKMVELKKEIEGLKASSHVA